MASFGKIWETKDKKKKTMKKTIVITFMLLGIVTLSGCGQEKALTEVEQAAELGLSLEKYRETKLTIRMTIR